MSARTARTTRSARTASPAAGGLFSRFRPEQVLLAVVVGLVFFGLVMVYSASSATALLSDGDPLGLLVRQGIYALIGAGAFVLFSRASPDTLRKLAAPGFVVSAVLLLAVLIPGLGTEVNGSRRWLVLGGGAQLQPSELAKLALILWIAGLVAARPGALRTPRGLAPILIGAGFLIALILLEPDLGTALVLAAAAIAMTLVAGARGRHLALVAGATAGFAALSVAMVGYRRDRLSAFLDPWADPEGAGFQVVQAQIALGSGGLTGVGLGDGIQKAFYLPEAHTDMILATVGEELGLVGVVGLLAAYAVFAAAGYRIALDAADVHQQVIAAGLTTAVVVQAAVNAGAVLGALPVTGVPLPFVSFGGSSLVIALASAGILTSIARRRRAGADLRVVRAPAGGDRGKRDGRARHAGAGGGRSAARARR